METISVLTTVIQTPRMNIVELFIKREDIFAVSKLLSESGAKYYPFEKTWVNVGNFIDIGYRIRVDDHPIISFIALKYAVT